MDGHTIGRLRKRMGLTQADLAAMVAVDQGTVSRWERGYEEPRPSTQKALRQALIYQAESSIFVQACARVRSNVFASYIFDHDRSLTAISEKAIDLISTWHGVSIERLCHATLASHFADLGLPQSYASTMLQSFEAGDATAMRIFLRRADGITTLYLEPLLVDDVVIGLSAWAVDEAGTSPHVDVYSAALLSVEGEFVGLERYLSR